MTWTGPAFEALAKMLAERTGLAFAPDRRPGFELGIRRAMGRAGLTDLERYLPLLEQDVALFDDLVGELTIGETYFFREPDQFEFLRRTVLPEFRRRWGEHHVFRAWSAGCASGEEAYTLAMVFAEEGLADRAQLLATDISPAALAKARGASYGPWSLRGEGATAALPHLHRRGGRFVVKDSIRRRVMFEQLNLADESYPSPATGTWGLDLIFCRNVLIYFDRETIRAVAGRLFNALGAGGWLITASSDPPLADEAPFETAVTDHGVFYRRGNTAAALPGSAEVRAGGTSVPGPWFTPSATAIEASPPTRAPQGERTSGHALPDQTDHRLSSPAAAHGEAAKQVSCREGDRPPAHHDLAPGRSAETAGRPHGPGDMGEAAALRVRALANLDLAEAERACAAASERDPLSGELHYLRAVLLHGLGRDDEAVRSARRVLYLDRSLAIAHFLLGMILRRRGNREGAWRSFRNARDLCAARPGTEVVPLSDGEPAARLADAAAMQMARLELVEDRP